MACSAQSADQTWPDEVAALEDYPPSVKLVAKVLYLQGEHTQTDLVEETLLPARTVRYAVNTLKEDGHLEIRYCFEDARKRLYKLEMRDAAETTAT